MLTATEVHKVLKEEGISKNIAFVYKKTRDGELKGILKDGLKSKGYRYSEEDVQSFISNYKEDESIFFTERDALKKENEKLKEKIKTPTSFKEEGYKRHIRYLEDELEHRKKAIKIAKSSDFTIVMLEVQVPDKLIVVSIPELCVCISSSVWSEDKMYWEMQLEGKVASECVKSIAKQIVKMK